MIQRNQDKRPQAKGNARKPEIRDDLDSRENQEFRTKEQMKKPRRSSHECLVGAYCIRPHREASQ